LGAKLNLDENKARGLFESGQFESMSTSDQRAIDNYIKQKVAGYNAGELSADISQQIWPRLIKSIRSYNLGSLNPIIALKNIIGFHVGKAFFDVLNLQGQPQPSAFGMTLVNKTEPAIGNNKVNRPMIKQINEAGYGFQAGFRKNDFIRTVNQIPVNSNKDFYKLLSDAASQTILKIEVLRDGETRYFELKKAHLSQHGSYREMSFNPSDLRHGNHGGELENLIRKMLAKMALKMMPDTKGKIIIDLISNSEELQVYAQELFTGTGKLPRKIRKYVYQIDPDYFGSPDKFRQNYLRGGKEFMAQLKSGAERMTEMVGRVLPEVASICGTIIRETDEYLNPNN
jgi:hypothetical protein